LFFLSYHQVLVEQALRFNVQLQIIIIILTQVFYCNYTQWNESMGVMMKVFSETLTRCRINSFENDQRRTYVTNTWT